MANLLGTTLNKYQHKVQDSRPEGADKGYMVLGLVGTVGGLANELASSLITGVSPQLRESLKYIMWFTAGIASDAGLTLEDVIKNDD